MVTSKKRLALSSSSSPSVLSKRKIVEAISRRKRQRCESLRMDAHSYGAYVWRERDLRNALKWFNETTTKSRHEFLQTLLCSRGILEYRPIKKQQIMMIGTKNKEEMMIEKQKPLFKTVLLSMTDTDTTTTTTTTTTSDEDATTKCSSDSIIHCNQSTNVETKSNSNDERGRNNDEKESWRKNHLLRKNLQMIIQNRTITNQLYILCDSMSETTFQIKHEKKKSNINNIDEEEWSFCASQPPTFFQNNSCHKSASKEALQYFSSPQTALRKTYASQLFDRLIELQQQKLSRQESIKLHTQQQNKGVEIFLEKLQRLAENDSRIQETVLFLLLESYTKRIKYHRDLNEEYFDPNEDLHSGHDVDKSLFAFIPKIESFILSFAPSPIEKSDNDENDSNDVVKMGIWGSPSPLLCSVSHSNTKMIAEPYIKYLILSSLRIQKLMTNSIAKDVIREGGLHQCYKSDDEEYVDRAEFDSMQKLKKQNQQQTFHQYQDFILRLRDLCSSTTVLKNVVNNLFETFDDWSNEDFSNNRQPTLYQSKECGIKDNWNSHLSSIRDDLNSNLSSK